ncbi:alpha/beta fold hydrolase [Mesobacillus harenae]|uniref:alpha/beta fold hydrolase n=1 Tax=Mesobacillus harenae TaxID=2213203 RepID=UPI001580D3E5|nr:alpha/beta hydrolase [Mesobacillus harenae]
MDRIVDVFTVKGRSIEYSIVGKGDPVLVLHGGHSNCYEEFGYGALVEYGFSVITPSRPGYGGTSKEAGASLETACDDYAALLHHLNVRKVQVISVSAGGPSGIYLAARHPELVSSLILQSAVTKEWLVPNDKEYKAAKILFRPGVEKYTWKMISRMNNLFPEFIFKQMFPSFSSLAYKEAKERMAEGDIEAVRKMNNRQRSGDGFLLDLEQVNEINTEHLQAISCPTLILHSKHDSSVPLQHAYHADENIGNSQLCLLDSWGHLIWLGESAKETDEKVVGFLRSINKLELVK